MTKVMAALFVVGALAWLPVAAHADLAPTPAHTLSVAQARMALDVLNDPHKRAQFAATLEAIIQAGGMPAKPNAASQPATAQAPATQAPPAVQAPAPPPSAAPPSKVALAPGSLGAVVLVSAAGFLGHVASHAMRAAQAIQSIPLLWGWMVVMATNPVAYSLLQQAVWRVALAAACGLVLEWLVRRAVREPVRILETRGGPATPAPDEPAPEPILETEEVPAGPDELAHRRRVATATLLRRLPLVFTRFLLDLLPVIGFAVGGHILAASPLGGTAQTRLIVVAMVDAYAICSAVMCFTRMLVAPRVGRLRLLQVTDATAAWTTRWIRRLTLVAVFGYTIAEVGLVLGMSNPAHEGLLKMSGLINHIFMAIMVLQKRRAVRQLLRAPADATGAVARLRNAIAPVWHWIALFFLVALWFVWAVEIRNGFAKVLHFFVALTVAAIIARLVLIVLLGSLERMVRPPPEMAPVEPGIGARLTAYYPVLAGVARVVVYLVGAVLLLEVWGVPVFAWFASSFIGLRLAAGLGTMVLTLILALAVWELANVAIEAHLARLTREQQVARATRLRTLLPLLRSTLMVVIVVIAGLTVLSEIGINIGPLLAGAGIVGVAIGFGSQKLVQDLITGIFLLLENAMQVGDWVTVSGLSGSVENLSVRTIRLRAGDGSVHIIPFSAVTSVTNTNRGLGNAAVEVAVAYHEDTDRVGALLGEIVEEMRQQPDYAARVLNSLQLWGVDKVDGASATIKGVIPCTASGRWPVQREFNRRVKMRFQELGIAIFNPAQTYVVPSMQAMRRGQLPPPHEEAAE